MTQNLMIALLGLFLITSLTNILATLKTMLISKKIMNPVYMIVFVDAMIFATVITKITSSEGLHFTVVYALGRTFGVFIGGKLEGKMALGIIEVDIFFKNKDKMILIAENLRTVGYTVNNYVARGRDGERRYKIEVVLKRKEYKNLEGILDSCGVENPTLKIKNLSKVDGKITTSSFQTA